MDTQSTNLQTHGNSFGEHANRSETPTWVLGSQTLNAQNGTKIILHYHEEYYCMDVGNKYPWHVLATANCEDIHFFNFKQLFDDDFV